MVHCRTIACAGLLAGLCLAGGCEMDTTRPPVTLAEYSVSQKSGRSRYPGHTIVQYNLQRVLDTERKPAERVDSLKVVSHLGGDDPNVRNELAAVISDPNCPKELHQPALEFLIRTGGTDAGQLITQALTGTEDEGRYRDAVLTWLTEHPQPDMLSKVVKLWADEPATTGLHEPRYRLIVEKVSGKSWDQALIDGINSPEFTARGSAVEVLARRTRPSMLRLQITRTTPRTDAMLAIHAFINLFNYLPSDRPRLIAAVSLLKTRRGYFEDAARLNQVWHQNYGYLFDVRDFHLLSRLARDPLRTNLRRTHLILELGKTVGAHQHVAHTPSRTGAPDDYVDRYWLQIDSLTMSDLWYLRLLDEMLTRPRVQMALKIMADRDRADTQGAWGGLVFYENGQAEAKLYPRGQQTAANDLAYTPSYRLAVDGRDALCRFHAHFEKIDNAARAGPDTAELADAKRENYCGLILTSVSKAEFCAHYHNPQGIVISLGKYPFRW